MNTQCGSMEVYEDHDHEDHDKDDYDDDDSGDDDKPLQAGQWGWRLGLASATPLIPFLDTPADYIHVMINDDFNHDQDVLCALTRLQFLSI